MTDLQADQVIKETLSDAVATANADQLVRETLNTSSGTSVRQDQLVREILRTSPAVITFAQVTESSREMLSTNTLTTSLKADQVMRETLRTTSSIIPPVTTVRPFFQIFT